MVHAAAQHNRHTGITPVLLLGSAPYGAMALRNWQISATVVPYARERMAVVTPSVGVINCLLRSKGPKYACIHCAAQ
jgi:hypothetical protein